MIKYKKIFRKGEKDMKKFIAYLGICSCLVAQTIKVGVNAEMPPFEFVENGQIIGFDIDLANELSKRLGFDIKIVEESYTDICKKINANELDIGISSFGDDEYTADCDHSVSYYESSLLFVKLKNRNDLTKKEDLIKKTVVAFDETSDSIINGLKELNATIKTVKSVNIMSVLFPLEEKKADATILPSINKGILIDGYPYLGTRDKQILDSRKEMGMPPIEFEVFYEEVPDDSETIILFPKDGRLNDLKERINAEIIKMKEDGMIEKMLKKYEL